MRRGRTLTVRCIAGTLVGGRGVAETSRRTQRWRVGKVTATEEEIGARVATPRDPGTRRADWPFTTRTAGGGNS